MGLVFVLTLYIVGLTVGAAIGAAVLGGICSLLTRKAQRGRKRAMTASLLFPFASAGFAAAWFVVYAIISVAVFHRDPGLGDSWNTPLPNGYAINMIDVTDQGTVYDPRTQRDSDSISNQDDAVFGVRKLQVSGNHIFGAEDTGYFGRIGQESNAVDKWFELNAAEKTHAEFNSLDELKKRAASEGVELELKPIAQVYSAYRFTWFDYAAGAILLLVPLCGFVLLARFVLKTRRATSIAVQ